MLPFTRKRWVHHYCTITGIRYGTTRTKSNLHHTYSRYYAEACNQWRGPSPQLSAGATQLRRNVAAVARRWRNCDDLTGPGIEPQISRTVRLCAKQLSKRSVELTTRTTLFQMLGSCKISGQKSYRQLGAVVRSVVFTTTMIARLMVQLPA